jgi:hypothetical protein
VPPKKKTKTELGHESWAWEAEAEEREFEASLGYTVRLSQNKHNTPKRF